MGIAVVDLADWRRRPWLLEARDVHAPLKLGGFGPRLEKITDAIKEMIVKHRPRHAVLEVSLMGKSARSGISLAEARGAIMHCLHTARLKHYQIYPNQLKSVVAGHGHADKEAMRAAVLRSFGTKNVATLRKLGPDALDAVACALAYPAIIDKSL